MKILQLIVNTHEFPEYQQYFETFNKVGVIFRTSVLRLIKYSSILNSAFLLSSWPSELFLTLFIESVLRAWNWPNFSSNDGHLVIYF